MSKKKVLLFMCQKNKVYVNFINHPARGLWCKKKKITIFKRKKKEKNGYHFKGIK